MVGYQTFGATKNTYLLKSIQFDGVTETFNIKDLTGDLQGPAWDDTDAFKSTAPLLEVRNGDGYDFYYFLSDGVYDAATGTYSPGWADVGGNPLPPEGVEIAAGTAFWLIDQYSDTSSLTTPGAIVSDSTTKIDFAIGYNLAGCPYPKAIALSEITFTGLESAPAWDDMDSFKDTAPLLEVRDGEGYTFYYYLSDGKYDAATGVYSPGWADVGGNPLPDYDAKVISAGTAFWLVLRNSETNVSATFSL